MTKICLRDFRVLNVNQGRDFRLAKADKISYYKYRFGIFRNGIRQAGKM
ncbi:hypothetical protein CLOAM1856 [Candidatus Cloacimonas acidaminovorans str. Evry]|uniref:Uncharacterized protein n=1 Tax=Cloacimonas acidaminovorans (strain Evry) TaxID=459349 RepID=B0VET9_CLOAI|nr:hypothetical protein CLOAM1856 [Candidatus Cloacimonas acidaminovorans str. Evry]